METNRPGNATAKNTKPKRAASAANTPRAELVSCGELTAAKNRRMKPQGNKNQPESPRSVIFSNAPLNQCGSFRAQPTAMASKKNMDAAAASTRAMLKATVVLDAGRMVERRDLASALNPSATLVATLCTSWRTAASVRVPWPAGVVVLSRCAFGAFTVRSLFQTPRVCGSAHRPDNEYRHSRRFRSSAWSPGRNRPRHDRPAEF